MGKTAFMESCTSRIGPWELCRWMKTIACSSWASTDTRWTQYSWEIPEGGVPLDEEPLSGAQRELMEETGYTAAKWQELGRGYLSNSVSDEHAIYFLAEELIPGTPRPEGTERLSQRWVTFPEALALVERGE